MEYDQKSKSWIASVASQIRGLCSQQQHFVGYWNDSKIALAILANADTSLLTKNGPEYPENILKLGICPVFLDTSSGSNIENIEQDIQTSIRDYLLKYSNYVQVY